MKKPHVLLRGIVVSHAIRSEAGSLWLWTPAALCTTWRQRAAAQRCANTASCRPSTRPMALCHPHRTAHILAHAVSRHEWMNRTEGVHQFHAVFASSRFSLWLCLSGTASLFLCLFSPTSLKFSGQKFRSKKFQVSFKMSCIPAGVWWLGVSEQPNLVLIAHLWETFLFQYTWSWLMICHSLMGREILDLVWIAEFYLEASPCPGRFLCYIPFFSDFFRAGYGLECWSVWKVSG